MPKKPPETELTPERLAWRRRMLVAAWRALALLSLGLGLLGVVLPVMPTVPFLIVSAWAASQGWPVFERWLLAHPTLGPPIVQWRERGAVPRRAKWASSLMMACSAVGLQFFDQVPLWLRVTVPAVMLAVAVWLWFRPDA
ncbi:YbaN family protein [Ottowia sp.]|uniref:YbaN family protein n=1 Tax=Ottowia sp. TaxID=1898956 RepID=UPI003A88F836